MALILIVDDSPTEVFVMQKALEKHGFKTAAAENGEEGVRKAKAMKPDLIFMDIVMPGVNGYQATRMLDQRPGNQLDPHHHGDHQGPGDRPGLGPAPGRGGLSGQAGIGAGVGREGTGRTGRMTSTMSGTGVELAQLARPAVRIAQGTREAQPHGGGRQRCPKRSPGKEWVGVAFRMGGETFLVAREETREVLGYPAAVTRIPGAKSWVKGLANVRGQLLPMLDLRQFLGSGATTSGRNTRVVVVNHRDIPAGLMVDEVLGFRRFAETEFNAEAPPTVIRCDSYLAGAFRRGGEVWPVLELEELGGEPELPAGGELDSVEHEMSTRNDTDPEAESAGRAGGAHRAVPGRRRGADAARRAAPRRRRAARRQLSLVVQRIPFEAQNALRGESSAFDALAKSAGAAQGPARRACRRGRRRRAAALAARSN